MGRSLPFPGSPPPGDERGSHGSRKPGLSLWPPAVLPARYPVPGVTRDGVEIDSTTRTRLWPVSMVAIEQSVPVAETPTTSKIWVGSEW
jgi:hypothetical protein